MGRLDRAPIEEAPDFLLPRRRPEVAHRGLLDLREAHLTDGQLREEVVRPGAGHAGR